MDLHLNLAYVGLALGSLALFVAAYVIARLATRPARPRAAAATPDLATEPPAVVNLLANRWRINEDAGEATLLDLAARGFLEFRQPGNDPNHTTIHLREQSPDAALLPYERRVLDRVRALAVAGVLPVTALTFRNAPRARQWHRRLEHEIVRDARARGLSRRRFGTAVVTALVTVAGISATGLALATLGTGFDAMFSGLYVGVSSFALFSALAGKSAGERDTPAGRAAAAHWAGLRDWLRAHEQFADLPPAAVTVWDRYLPYGAALGVTHTTSAVLDLGMGDRRRVWSSYGGHWRRVRVRYPRGLLRYGRTVPRLVLRGGLWLGFGSLLTLGFGLPTQLLLGRADTPTSPPPAAAIDLVVMKGWDILSVAAMLVGPGLAALGGYILIRALTDLGTTRTITGEVLWLEKWRSRSQGKDSPSVPWLHYLAIDDGQQEHTRAWGLPSELVSQVHDRDVATIEVRPWSRRIVNLTVVERGRTRALVDTAVEPPDEPVQTVFGAALTRLRERSNSNSPLNPPPPASWELLTADEVSRAVGVPVHGPIRVPGPPSLVPAAYHTVERDRQVLLIHVRSGRLGKAAWNRVARVGTAVPGIGDGALCYGEQAMLRVGESVIMLVLSDAGRAATPHLPWLLAQAAARLASRHRPLTGDGATAT